MVDYIKIIIKRIIKIFKWIENRYNVNYEYGWLHKQKDIEKFRNKVLKDYRICERFDIQKETKFIFIGDKNLNSTMRIAVFGDIDRKNVEEFNCSFYTTRVLKNKKLEKAHKLYWKINRRIPLLGKSLWEELYTTQELRKCIEDTENNYAFVFLAGAYFEETFSQYKLWKNICEISCNTNVKRILYLVDPVDKFPNIKSWFSFFDIVTGCAPEDVERHGIVYIDTPCVDLDLSEEECNKDIYIRALNNGRSEIIKSIYDLAEQNHVNCDFHIQELESVPSPYKNISFTLERIPYTEMVQEEMQANVLLEIVVPGVGAGTTLRYKEAVMYGKKLLTNNPTVFNLPCFDSRWIHFFSAISDIDFEWVKKREKVEYRYNREFSVDMFCKRLLSIL